ncbi:MAG: EF-P lysine aminoacylase EpmA [Dehalococcoidia bacterium]|nr:EF-P lysine aminoacylase EpmA [Dehalococcoidia bacterium]
MPSERERLTQIKGNLQRRSQLIAIVRHFFEQRGFLEVETPIRVPSIAPELNITAQQSDDWYLITSPELHMKRLLAAGYGPIFQVSRCFRKGEQGRLHNPEFNLLEWYRPDSDYTEVIHDVEQLIAEIATAFQSSPFLTYQGTTVDISPPWPRLSIREAFRALAGWDPTESYNAERFDNDMALKVLPALDTRRPLVLNEYPAPAASLARLKYGEPALAERAEVYIGGMELANAYSELTDVSEQRQRFKKEIAQIELEQGKKLPLAESFLEALNYLPECSGIALGLDRLVMLFCNATHIEEIWAFSEENI